MVIVGETGGKGTKAIATNYPIEKGLVGGTTKQTGRQMNLLPQGLLGVKTIVLQRDKELI